MDWKKPKPEIRQVFIEDTSMTPKFLSHLGSFLLFLMLVTRNIKLDLFATFNFNYLVEGRMKLHFRCKEAGPTKREAAICVFECFCFLELPGFSKMIKKRVRRLE